MSELNQKQKQESQPNQQFDVFTIQKSNQPPSDLFKNVGCNCKKNQCGKNNCECFLLKKKCSESCRCLNCENVEGAQYKKKKKLDDELKKNRKSCQCKKTQCLKKYCDCFNSGQICNESCRCEDCKNTSTMQLNIIPHNDTEEFHHYSELMQSNQIRSERKEQQVLQKVDKIIKIVPSKYKDNILKYLVFSLAQE